MKTRADAGHAYEPGYGLPSAAASTAAPAINSGRRISGPLMDFASTCASTVAGSDAAEPDPAAAGEDRRKVAARASPRPATFNLAAAYTAADCPASGHQLRKRRPSVAGKPLRSPTPMASNCLRDAAENHCGVRARLSFGFAARCPHVVAILTARKKSAGCI